MSRDQGSFWKNIFLKPARTPEEKLKRVPVGGCLLASLLLIWIIFMYLATQYYLNYQRFRSYQSRVSAAEARNNLISIQAAEDAYYGKYGVYAGGPDCFSLLGWGPPTETIFGYFCDEDYIACSHCPNLCPAPPSYPVSENSFTASAVGNIDRDEVCDYWTINEQNDLRNHSLLPNGQELEGGDRENQ